MKESDHRGRPGGGTEKESLRISRAEAIAIRVRGKRTVTVLRRLQRMRASRLLEASKAYEHATSVGVLAEIAKVPVEELSQQGVGQRAVNSLKGSGIKNFRQLARMSDEKLKLYPGVGTKTALLISKSVLDAQKRVADGYQLSFDRKSKSQTSLARAISDLAFTLQVSNQVLSESERAGREILIGLEKTKTVESAVRYFFCTRSRKREIADAVAALEERLAAVDPLRRTVERVLKREHGRDREDAWQLLEDEPATFYSVLDSIGSPEKIRDDRLGNLSRTRGPSASQSPTTITSLDDADCGRDRASSKNLDHQHDWELERLVRSVDALTLDATHRAVVLRPYQEFGAKFAIHQQRVIIGDEMGLGKTIEAIAILSHLAAQGQSRFLVAAPASLLSNWVRELSLRSRLKIRRPHGAALAREWGNWHAHGGVAVMSIDTLKGLYPLDGQSVDALIVDEAQLIKNISTQRAWVTRAWAQVASVTVLLTGSPLENNVDEFLALESIIRDGKASLGEQYKFTPEPFRRAIAPVYIRRTQDEVLKELPPLIRKDEWIPLSGLERQQYERAIVERDFHAARRVGYSRATSSKVERVLDLVAEARRSGKKTVVFSYYRATLDLLASAIEMPVFGPFDGRVSVERRAEIVEGFDRADGDAVFLAQIVTGGQGLNLQRGNVAILCEPQLKPSVEEQAVARLYRMGQTAPVHAHRIISEATLEERLLARLHQKQEIFDDYVHRSAIGDESHGFLEDEETSLVRTLLDEENAFLDESNDE